jgi:hypothetical protein
MFGRPSTFCLGFSHDGDSLYVFVGSPSGEDHHTCILEATYE